MGITLPIVFGLAPVSLIVLGMLLTMRGRRRAGWVCAILAVATFGILEIAIAYSGR